MPRIGETDCRHCDTKAIAVKETAGGQLSATCHLCQTQVYAPRGSKGHRDLHARTRLDNPPAPAAAPPAAAAAAAAPGAVVPRAAKPAGFNMNAL